MANSLNGCAGSGSSRNIGNGRSNTASVFQLASSRQLAAATEELESLARHDDDDDDGDVTTSTTNASSLQKIHRQHCCVRLRVALRPRLLAFEQSPRKGHLLVGLTPPPPLSKFKVEIFSPLATINVV